YELIEDAAGDRPILAPFSEMAGMLAVHLAGYYLQNDSGGRGILLGNVPGIAPPTVVILGAGIAGRTAACHARATGARVVVVDTDMAKLRAVSSRCGGQVATANASLEPLENYTASADVLIGAVLIPGSRAPILVTEDMVEGMRRGSVIVDLSIDQGGCVETSRPTSLDQPTFIVHDVVHYCVPNMTANVARTASKVLTRAVLPQLVSLAERGTGGAAAADPHLAAGVVMYEGNLVHAQVASAHGLPFVELRSLLAGAGA
ncbi:MAG TPA: alanine dehydrogenase, partial [Actinobacteria bacterium]|nr:alanine dehydrogenase [Actinomycetota bacterium]